MSRSNFYTSSFRRYTIALILTLVVISAGFLSATEWLIRTHVLPPPHEDDRFTKHLKRFLAGGSGNVILGDSTLLGVEGVDGFLNISYGAENPQVMEVKLRVYFKDKRPGRVILTADPTIFKQRESQREKAERYLVAGATRDPEAAGDHNVTSPGPLLWMFEKPHRDFIYNYWKLYITRGELRPSEPSWSQMDAKERQVAANNRVKIMVPRRGVASTQNGQAYKSILAFLAVRGARVCLLEPPMSPEFRVASSMYGAFRSGSGNLNRGISGIAA